MNSKDKKKHSEVKVKSRIIKWIEFQEYEVGTM